MNDLTPPLKTDTVSSALTLDMDKYLKELEDWDAPEKDKRAFIEAMWKLLINFGEIGFNFHPVQLVQMLRDMSTSTNVTSDENASNASTSVLSSRYTVCTQTQCVSSEFNNQNQA